MTTNTRCWIWKGWAGSRRKKSFISLQDGERLRPGLRRPAASGQVFAAKWILSGSGISAECTPPRPLQVLLIIQFQIKLQKAANAVLMLGGKGHISPPSPIFPSNVLVFIFNFPPFFLCSAPSALLFSSPPVFFFIRLYDQPEIYVPFSRLNSQLRFNGTRGLFFSCCIFQAKPFTTNVQLSADIGCYNICNNNNTFYL